MVPELKVGDTVTCIDAGQCGCLLTLGNTYIIDYLGRSPSGLPRVHLSGIDCGYGFMAERFKVITSTIYRRH